MPHRDRVDPQKHTTLEEIRVRHARAADLESWAAMRQALWPDESPGELRGEAAKFFTGGDTLLRAVLLAETSDGTVAGFAELSLRPYAEDCRTSPVAFLEGWYVTPPLRRRGVGRVLVAAAEEWARAQGCSELASDTQFDNTLSIRAHQALGFQDAGALRCFRKDLI
jgi:aminoglycoside 6'-N-acetyltransferase I